MRQHLRILALDIPRTCDLLSVTDKEPRTRLGLTYTMGTSSPAGVAAPLLLASPGSSRVGGTSDAGVFAVEAAKTRVMILSAIEARICLACNSFLSSDLAPAGVVAGVRRATSVCRQPILKMPNLPLSPFPSRSNLHLQAIPPK